MENLTKNKRKRNIRKFIETDNPPNRCDMQCINDEIEGSVKVLIESRRMVI